MNHVRTPALIAPAPPANLGVPAIVAFVAHPATASVGAHAVGGAEQTMTHPLDRPVEPAPDDDPPEEWDEEVLEDLPEEEQTPVTPT